LTKSEDSRAESYEFKEQTEESLTEAKKSYSDEDEELFMCTKN